MKYETTKHKKFNRVKIAGESNMNIIKVNTKAKSAKATYKKALVALNADIKAERAKRKAAKRAIKQLKLLKKQARNTYKLTKIGA